MADALRRQLTPARAGLAALVLLLGGLIQAQEHTGRPAPPPPAAVPPVALTPQPAPPPPSLVASWPPVAISAGVSDFILGSAPLSLAAPRFTFTIDPSTPAKKLLPVAPKGMPAGVWTGDDLTRVPEVVFQAPHAGDDLASEASKPPAVVTALEVKGPATTVPGGPAGESLATRRAAYLIARVNHLNTRAPDGFLKALVADRPDLAGLPLVMGEDCHTRGERARHLATAARTVRAALATGNPAAFWQQFQVLCANQDASPTNLGCREQATVARVGILMQMLAAESVDVRLGLTRYLAGVSHPEATRALAKLAIFSPEESIREAALDALKVRRERDYTAVLVKGLRYPYPAVARRAADALVKLERVDLVPELLDVLEEPDPRAPKAAKGGHVVEELVRLNHHQSCVLCHAPGNTGKETEFSVTAEVPVPGQPMPAESGGYQNSTPDLLVRADVTYLRGDFSARQAVADAAPWPEMQRFDFVVRKRTLTDDEAAAAREAFGRLKAGELSPYHRAALAALREITGKDTEPTAAAWRKLLARAE